ncbi:MAG: RNA polymerase sigma factor SigA [Verrucomicrobia bacterium ADurb.Bin118]|jgi:RNA polymerase primary sigma factor|nr:MAG: RNA polymerase sigma factor SigA [Verrucomicrobia bacterium ADurb.Bin118]
MKRKAPRAVKKINPLTKGRRKRTGRTATPVRRVPDSGWLDTMSRKTLRSSLEPTVSRPTEDLVESRRGPGEAASAITLYMREVGEVALLTPQEEVKLAARIKRGDKAAREHMIRANLRLVVKIAREYEGLGLPLLDLINEGNIGLMKAVERFDPAKGGKLSTYSSWWIKQSIRRALANQGKTIRLPVHVADKIYHLRLAELRLQEALGREPTEDELAQELKTTPRRVAALRTAAIRPASLDAPLGDEDSSRLGDVVADEAAANPAEALEHRTTAAKVLELVERLPDREASILRFRFGLHGGSEKTLEEVGVKFGVTRERIRQLQNLALGKLRQMLEEDLEAMGVAA